MTPPATCNRFARYCLNQPGHRAFARYEHDPVLLHERLCLIDSHHARIGAARSYLAQCKLMPSRDKGKDQKGFISVTMLARRLRLSYWS